MGAGRPSHRQTDRARPRRLREDGLGGAGARPLRMGGGATPGRGRRCPRPCPRGAVRPGDRPEPQHCPSGLAADVRSAPGRLQPRARLGPPRRPGQGQSAAARTPRLHRGGAVADGAPARSVPPRPDPGLPDPARRARHGERPGRCRRRAAGGGPRSTTPRNELSDRDGPRDRETLAAERRTVRS